MIPVVLIQWFCYPNKYILKKKHITYKLQVDSVN